LILYYDTRDAEVQVDPYEPLRLIQTLDFEEITGLIHTRELLMYLMVLGSFKYPLSRVSGESRLCIHLRDALVLLVTSIYGG
jgi:hypothetical protein